MSLEEELLEYIRQGKSSKDIARIKGCSGTTIQNWINKIDPQKVEEAKNDYLRQQEKEVLKLIEKSYTKAEIAQILGKSPTTIYSIMKGIDENKLEQARQKGKANKEYSVKKSTLATMYLGIKQKLEEKTLEETDIIAYREYIDRNLDLIELKEVVLMLNVYIKNGQTNKAVDFINLVIESDKNPNFDIKKLQNIKEQTQRVQDTQKQRNIQKAINWLEKNISVATIVYYTGLKEQEVMKLKEEVEAKKGIEI